MVAVFCRVTAEVSPHFIENFPALFDFNGMLEKICEDSGVTVSLVDEMYTLEGQWNTISRAHNMLVSTLAVYGSSSSIRKEQEGMISQGSRPFSALVEAAEAISRGVELQEQVQHEMMSMKKLSHISRISQIASGSIPNIPSEVSVHCSKDMPIIDDNLATSIHSDSDVAFHVETGSVSSAELNCDVSQNEMPSTKPVLLALPSNNEDQQKDVFTDCEDGCSQEEYIDSGTHDNAKWKNQNSSEAKDDDIVTKQMEIKYSDEKDKHKNKDQDSSSDIVLDCAISNSHSKDVVKVNNVEQESTYLENRGELQKKKRPCKRFKNEKGNDVFPCDECDFNGKTRNNLGDHKHRVHLAKPTQCDICDKVFPNVRYMKRHRSSHSKPQYCCDICGKQYKVSKALKDHKKRHDVTYVRPEFKCSKCPKTFCSNYILENHIKSEHMGLKKSFLCQACGKSFTTKHTLLQHTNVHIGARPYQCEDCGKSFSYESALRDHKYIHKGTRKFVCEYPSCNKAFRQRSALKMHEKIHNESKDFNCPECHRGFTQKQALQRHMRAHRGLKPFVCKLCCRTFGDASIIRRHMILVHKIHKDPTKWREDIIMNVKANKDLLGEVNEEQSSTLETDTSDQSGKTNTVAHVDQNQVFTVTCGTDSTGTHLLPMTDLHSFRASLDNYTTNDITGTEPALINSQDGSKAHYSLSVPHQHDYTSQTLAQTQQYQYTVHNLEPPPVIVLKNDNISSEQINEKPLELQHQSVIQHIKSVVSEQVLQEETEQYVDETVYNTIDDTKGRKTLETLDKSSSDLCNVIVSNSNETLETMKVGSANDVLASPAKEINDNKQAEVDVPDSVSISQLFAYYSSLASQYMNMGQYTGTNVSPSDLSTNNHLS